MNKYTYRSIWLSDLHLGSRDINSEYLLDFLQNNESEYLYLAGDIIDLWKLNHGWYWPEINNQIIELIFKKSQEGTKVVYIPGNHDDMFRKYVNTEIHGVKFMHEAVHSTADGRRFLIVHGDEFDPVTSYSRWLAKLGSDAYTLLLKLNRYVSSLRKGLGMKYWSLSAFLKNKVKEAVNFVGNFKKAIVREASKRKVDGMICGHVHHASFENVNGVLYSNTGDWVESCTALVENNDGSLQIVRWAEEYALLYDESSLATGHAYADCYSDRRLATPG